MLKLQGMLRLLKHIKTAVQRDVQWSGVQKVIRALVARTLLRDPPMKKKPPETDHGPKVLFPPAIPWGEVSGGSGGPSPRMGPRDGRAGGSSSPRTKGSLGVGRGGMSVRTVVPEESKAGEGRRRGRGLRTATRVVAFADVAARTATGDGRRGGCFGIGCGGAVDEAAWTDIRDGRRRAMSWDRLWRKATEGRRC